MKNLLVVLSVALFAGCSPRQGQKSITLKGSDTMVILGQRWAETFMHHTKGVTVQVTGGGSGTGIAALINGGTDICQSSRPMKQQEKDDAKKKHNKDVAEIPVALDGLAVYVHPGSPLKEITLAQVRDIYLGKVTNWKDLGGEDKSIIKYSRENSSGTYDYFREHVLGKKDFADDTQYLQGTATVVNTVGKDPKSIGYGGIGYNGQGVKALLVKKDDASPAVEPTLDNVQSGKYPLSRELFFYTLGAPAGELKGFIDWVLGPEGQQVCEKVGYYPLRKK